MNILEGVRGDVRTPDKLVDGVYDTDDGKHMWLAPVLPDMVSSTYSVPMVTIWVAMVAIWVAVVAIWVAMVAVWGAIVTTCHIR